jgi:hypothetical protein
MVVYQSYSTEFSNQVHQLTIAVSKHYWVTNEHVVKYQIKPMEMRLINVSRSQKTHLVIYSVRDHFSGLFYSAAASSSSLPSAVSFLSEAWSKKPEHSFSGQPIWLTIPDTVEAAFPGTRNFALALGVQLIPVTSGFQGGIRDIRTIEVRLKFCHDQSLEFTINDCTSIARYSEAEPSKIKGMSKAQFWQQNLRSATTHAQSII